MISYMIECFDRLGRRASICRAVVHGVGVVTGMFMLMSSRVAYGIDTPRACVYHYQDVDGYDIVSVWSMAVCGRCAEAQVCTWTCNAGAYRRRYSCFCPGSGSHVSRQT